MKKFLLLASLFVTSCSKNFITDYVASNSQGSVNVVIEIPAGTNEKWEITKPDGKLSLEYRKGKPRTVNYLPYPFNYGMIPNSLLAKENGGDGDPLDAIVIGNAIKRGSVVEAKVIGVLKMLDRGEQDDKIITVAKTSPLYQVNSIKELDRKFPGVSQIIKTWFKYYKGKSKMKIQGYQGPKKAQKIIHKAIDSAS